MATRRKDTNRTAAKQVSKVRRTAPPKKRDVAKSKRVGTKRKPAGRKRETKKRAPVKAVVKSAKDAFRKILLVLDPEATKTVSPVEIKF